MNPLKYAQMMKYLTRAKKVNPELPDVFPASKAPIPAKTKIVEEMEAVNRFVRANPRTEKAGGGMLVQPGFGGTRQGYAKDKRGFGSEKGPKFKAPSKNQLTQVELIDLFEKEFGPEYKFKRGSLSGPGIREGVQQPNYFRLMLKDLLDRKAIPTRGEQVRFVWNKPNAQQLDFIKTFIDAPIIGQQTIQNMEILNKKFGKKLSKASGKKFFLNDLTIDMARKALEDAGVKNVTTSKLARAMTRLAQTYQGKLFQNQPNIKINKKAGNFIFQSFNELDQYHPWRQGSYEAVLDDIDAALGKKVGNLSAFKVKFKEKMLERYPNRKFNFNEVFSISTSANRGSYPYAYFVDLTEDAMNKGALASLQGKASIAEGKIQENITKYRRTGNIKFYNEAVRVADVYNNTTRKNFLDSKKVLDYEKKYGIKPNAYKIEIGSQKQVSDKLNFAKNFYKNSDLNKWKNMGIDIDSHSGQKGYVKTFDTKTLPENVMTAPELFTKESVLREQKIIDDKKLNKFFEQNKKLIATLSKDPRCNRGLKSQGGRAGFQDGNPPSLDVCYQGGIKNINSGMKNVTPAQAKNFAAFANRAASLGRGVMKYGIVPEALYVAADSLIRVGMGDNFNEAFLRATEYLRPGDQTKLAETLEADRFFGPEIAGIINKSLSYKNELAKVQSLEDQKANLENLSGGDEFDYIGDLSQDVKNIDAQIKQATDNLNNKFKITDAERIYAERMQDEVDDARGAGSLFTKLKSKFRDVGQDQSDIETLGVPEKTQEDLNKRMLPRAPTIYKVKDGKLITKNLSESSFDEIRDHVQLLRSVGIKDSSKNLLEQRNVLRGMPLSQQEQIFGKEATYGASGTMGEPINKPVFKRPENVIGDMEKEIVGQTNVANPFDIDISDIGTGLRGFSAAGGGIAKQAGVSSGPPPESGPMSQGLQGLMKRVRNR